MRFGNLFSVVAAAAGAVQVEGMVEAHRSLRDWIDVIAERENMPHSMPVLNKRESHNAVRSEFANTNSSSEDFTILRRNGRSINLTQQAY
jgi:hypothetical protein